VGDKVIRLKTNLSDVDVEQLNTDFSDILVKGRKSQTLPQEAQDESAGLPCLVLYFNQRDLGRLYQLIAAINQLGTLTSSSASRAQVEMLRSVSPKLPPNLS